MTRPVSFIADKETHSFSVFWSTEKTRLDEDMKKKREEEEKEESERWSCLRT